MEWLFDSPVIQLLEQITPSHVDEIDEDYVQTMQHFIADAHQENETHLATVGTYRLDMFLASEYAFMKLRTYVDGRLDPDSDEGQLFMLQNYWQEFIDSARALMPALSDVVIQDTDTWQKQMQDLV